MINKDPNRKQIDLISIFISKWKTKGKAEKKGINK
jgi:hypothetical protein